MAEVDIEVGGRRYELACRDGEEDHLHLLTAMVNAKAADATKAVGGLGETRQLLLAALLLADELNDLRAANALAPPVQPQSSEAGLAIALERLADRMEALAARVDAGVEDEQRNA